MNYTPAGLKDKIEIQDIVTVHYFEFSKDYRFTGESHDFWELVYVDSGRIIASSDEKEILLKAGDIIFHKPDEWHNLRGDGEHASNVAIVSFISDSDSMKYFYNKIIKGGNTQKELISKIIIEAERLFETTLGDPYTNMFQKRKDRPFAGEQLILLYLAEFLISIVRNDIQSMRTSFVENTTNSLVNSVIDYLGAHISEKVSVFDVEKATNTSRTAVETAFKNTLGCGVISYFIKMKIELAKTYIREDNHNVTQIADMLGYESIHYFSRQFKAVTGMSPKEYSRSVKALGKVNEHSL